VPKRLALAILMLVSVSCVGTDGAGTSTTSPTGTTVSSEGLTFAIYETDDGARLRLQTGDEIVARLGLSGQSAPPWRVTEVPSPRILTIGEPQRILGPDSETGEPHDEIVLRAVGRGTTGIVFEQSGSGLEVAITVIVTG
jgi:hypothetical protein